MSSVKKVAHQVKLSDEKKVKIETARFLKGTKVCKNILKGGACKLGNCLFAHCKEEYNLPRCYNNTRCYYFNAGNGSENECPMVHFEDSKSCNHESVEDYEARTGLSWPQKVAFETFDKIAEKKKVSPSVVPELVAPAKNKAEAVAPKAPLVEEQLTQKSRGEVFAKELKEKSISFWQKKAQQEKVKQETSENFPAPPLTKEEIAEMASTISQDEISRQQVLEKDPSIRGVMVYLTPAQFEAMCSQITKMKAPFWTAHWTTQ